MCKSIQKITTGLLFLSMLSSCSREDVFTAKIEQTAEPAETIELSAEKIESDHLYPPYFSVFDTLLISSCPNSPEYIFYVSDIRHNKPLGEFVRRGQGPDEFLGLTPVNRIERIGDDVVALTYEPHRRQLIEWNITKSIETGNDSILRLGYYKNPTDCGDYAAMYRIGKSKYLGYTLGGSYYIGSEPLPPTYWILDGPEAAPVRGISIVKDIIRNENSVISEDSFFYSARSLSPDNTKIVDAMKWLEQINIIDLTKGDVRSYRIEGSPDEGIFDTRMEQAAYQYLDVACNDNFIYALYFGEPHATFKDSMGCYWLHVFDWNGKFEKKYRLPVSLMRIWMDTSSNILYGYSDTEDAIYKLNIN